LAQTLERELRDSITQLLALHGLAGQAQGEIMARLVSLFELRAKVDEGRAGLLGGALAGALAGIKADIASGGLTLGGGLLAGGLLGALGGVALARGFNRFRDREQSWLAWSSAALDSMVDAALLRYLAVAHFGRGRGEWSQGEAPPHWAEVVAAALAPQRSAFAAVWAGRGEHALDEAAIEVLARALKPPLLQATRDALSQLYPATPGFDA
ncbi:MAG: DUF3482 domain-containing protein, partial [Burkholderiaceae bacterium]